jgi:hypothetical protein
MSGYRLEEWVVLQRNTRIPEGTSLKEFVLERGENVNVTVGEAGTFDRSGFFLALSRRGRLYTLNLTASLILEEILVGSEPDAIAGLIVAEFDAAPDKAFADIEANVQILLEKHLIVPT